MLSTRVSSFFVPGVLLSLFLLGGCAKEKPRPAATERGALAVRVAPVETRSVRRIVESVGTLFPYDETIVSAEIDGRVISVNADLGDVVTQGQVLVRISDEEQKYLLAQTEAQLRMAAEKVGLKDPYDRITDVRSSSEVRRAQADLDDAEVTYKRVRSLVDQKIGSQSELDQAQSRYKVTQAAYDQSINQARNLLQDIERSKAVLDLQKKKLRDTVVVAPFSGRVKERQVTPGLFVRPNTPVFTIVKTNPIRLRLEIPERMAPWIKVGQIAEVTLEAYAEKKFQGKVWRISPTVDALKRTFVVESLIDNPKGDLKPGSYARATLPTDKTESVTTIPFAAVSYVMGANKAFVVKDGVVEARDVKLGDRFNEDVEITDGLQPGDMIATTQLNRLDSGTKVRVGGGGPGSSARSAP